MNRRKFLISLAAAGFSVLWRGREGATAHTRPAQPPTAVPATGGPLIAIPFFVGAPDSDPGQQAASSHTVYFPVVGVGNADD